VVPSLGTSPPSAAESALLLMRESVCLLFVSAVKRHRVDVLHVRPSWHSLAVCNCCVVAVV
jgi:hypothetical protein